MPGRLVHFELPAQDTARARSFYSDLFGWRFQDFEGPVEYHMLEGVEPGGAIYPSEGRERGPIVYFDVDDIDAAIARVNELGGTAEDKQPIPGIGWFTACHDSEGNEFSLFQGDDSAPGPGQ